MPPTAIGRTMKVQTWSAIAIQVASAGRAPPFAAAKLSIRLGPRKKTSSGTNRPQASRPPAKLSAASSGPMM